MAWSRSDIVIPVVFHIIYRTEDQNLSNEHIFSQLDRINLDFTQLDAAVESLPGSFRKRVAVPGIQFCIAQVDRLGNPREGILRKRTDIRNLASQSALEGGKRMIKHQSTGGSDPWHEDLYLNIWIGERDDGIAGDATFPGTSEGQEVDGIVLSFDVVGDRPDDDQGFTLGRTLTHEIAHYLDVYHLYGEETGCFNDDDYVEDTPTQFGPYFGTCGEEVSSCDSRDMDTNFLNFRDDDCLYYFTAGQVARMMQTLFTTRYPVISSGICTSSKPIPPRPLDVARILTTLDGVLVSLSLLAGETYSLYVYDLSGKLIADFDARDDHLFRLDTARFPSGVYVLTLRYNDTITSRTVFIP